MPLNVEKVKSGTGKKHLTLLHPAPSLTADPDQIFSAWVAGSAFRIPSISTKAGVQGVLFDLDGVLVDTAQFHYLAWKKLADELGVFFDPRMNHRFRGVGRMDCLDKLLGQHGRSFATEEKRVLSDRKNGYYLEMVKGLTPKDLAPGARSLAMRLKGANIRLGLVSASRNARLVLNLLGILDWFDTIIDGADVTKGKPDPEGFLLAASKMRVLPDRCIVIEDADAGIEAGHLAKMRCIGIGEAAGRAEVRVGAIGEVTVEMVEAVGKGFGAGLGK